MKTIFLLIESKVIAEFNNRKEAEDNRDNNIDFYPENDFKVIEQTIDDGYTIERF